jgi:hypothetical protein
MGQIESNMHQYREAGIRVKNLERALHEQDASLDMHMIGIEHKGQPSRELLALLPTADIITLELGRNVVKAALAGENTQLLKKSPFWKKVITTLKPYQEDKKIAGVEVNQTPRTAFKRFAFHNGINMLSTPLLVIEKENNEHNKLFNRLSEKEIHTLQTYHYLVTENEKVISSAITLFSKAAKKQQRAQYPVVLSKELSVVWASNKHAKQPSIAFMEPPHSSLQIALNIVERIITDSNIFETKAEQISEALAVIFSYLLTPIECTEAREIANAASQHIRASAPRNASGTYTVNHIGGALHTPILKTIFQDLLPTNPQTSIRTSDLSIAHTKVHLDTLLSDTIPFADRLSTVSVKDFEVTVDPERIGWQVAHAINLYGNDFAKRYKENRKA